MDAFVCAAATIALPVSSGPVIIIAIIIIAAILGIGSFLLLRTGGKKGSKATDANEASDWQRQAAAQQPGAVGGWNQQGAGGWNQQSAPGQAAGNWGQPPQQQGAGWGAPDTAGNWGQPPQQQGAGWGAPPPAQPPNSWNAGGNQAAPGQPAQPGWGAQQPGANAWGNQPAQDPWGQPAQPAQPAQDPWGQPAQPAQPAQDPWGQPAQPANPWAAQPAQPSPQQGQPQAAYGNNSSGPSWGGQAFGGAQAADPWAAQAAQQPAASWGTPAAPAPVSSPAGTPPWQQGGFGQTPGMMQDPTMFANNDGDKTMLRTTGPQGGLGFVRVEEGKEPGRIYEVRKEALSIGRSRESDIFLEDLAVSRLHASIVNMGNGNYALRDEGSANGTKVNGQLVSKNQTYPLQEGDRIQLGQTTLVFGRR